MIEIEYGIPIPPITKNCPKEVTDAMHRLAQSEVGCSIFIEARPASVSWISDRYNVGLSIRRVGNGYRVWRVK